MKELSFFLLKNSFGSKMRKGFKNFCNGDSSTSTLNQHHPIDISTLTTSPNYLNNYHNSSNDESNARHPTLEEMILQLDLEEKMLARRASKVDEYHHRMSCVNSSDILRSARNALNQYPRFSLDGKDAMYRSSFRNMPKPISRKNLPTKVAGESVVWCKPGVVGKLMGLDAMPVPSANTRRNSFSGGKDQRLLIKRQNLRKRTERENGDINNSDRVMMAAQVYSNRCSKKKGGYCTMNPPPVAVLELQRDEAGWPIRRFL